MYLTCEKQWHFRKNKLFKNNELFLFLVEITVIKAIRTRDKQTGNKTKVIMVTAINNTMAKSYAKRSGANGFLPKSEDRDDFKLRLFETIRNVMNEPAMR